MDVPAKGNILGRFVPARYIFAILGSTGMAIVYVLKVNLSVAMVAMLNHTAIKLLENPGPERDNFSVPSEVECKPSEITTHEEEADGPFIWSSEVQGIILSCYFWGYFISQIPGGRIAELFSAKWVMFFSVTSNVVCALLIPVMAELHYSAIVLMRVGAGIGSGVSGPAMHVLLSRWSPPSERSLLTALVYNGISLGTVVSVLLAGGLAATIGWESVFYVTGGLSCAWCGLWVVLVADEPTTQTLISMEEREMIVRSLGGGGLRGRRKKLPVPWKKMLTSRPFLAILVAHSCFSWGWYLLLIELPFYMKQVLKFNMTENAVTSALPYLSLWFFSMALSRFLNWLRGRGTITTTASLKISTLCAAVVPAGCLLCLCFERSRGAAVSLMTVSVTAMGGLFSGILSNHIYVAPNFAGTMMALSNTVASISAIVVPIFVGVLTHGNQTLSAWRIVFFVTIAFLIIEIIVYTLFASGEQQPWNDGEEKDNPELKSLNDLQKIHFQD